MNDTAKMERIGFRSTRGEGGFAKRRWTELALYYDRAADGGRCFVAETTGQSIVAGETPRVSRLAATTIDGAMVHFQDRGGELSAPAWSVAEQAQLWLAAGSAPPRNVYTDEQRAVAIEALFDRPQMGFTRDHAAASVDIVAAALGMHRETARG